MKGKVVLFLLLLLGGYLYATGHIGPDSFDIDSLREKAEGSPGSDNPSAETLRGEALSLGAERVSVSSSPNETLVRLGVPAVDGNLTGLLYAVAEKAYRANHSGVVRVEAYYLGEPIVALTVRNGDFENAEFEDIRTPEFRIETDLGLFDVVIHDVSVTNESATVSLEYLADRDGFWKDYFAMSLVVLEDAPWVGSVSITYLTENGSVTMTMGAGDIVGIHAGEIEDPSAVIKIERG
ncbi:hypothetical protein [Thermococcus barossii]|uniref:Uncharacterized protein n=1 Tax=Thermococcus barossii TaxID=54077 RepID=A0A2Z2MN87_9EURY|nr:hypothetical protein [Thermococcus barossii]ASJ05304.1 hypothetical protein A3L01_07985 [Thermococcus barossii]